MSVAVPLQRLLDYSDHERAKWREWIAADAARLNLPFQDDGRFSTLWSLLDHVFLVERRHLSRLEGATPPDTTGVPSGDWVALFEYADFVRADLRRWMADTDEEEAATPITVNVASGGFTMTRGTLATHIVIHEIRHLAQLAFAVRRAGFQPPGEHDFFYFAGVS